MLSTLDELLRAYLNADKDLCYNLMILDRSFPNRRWTNLYYVWWLSHNELGKVRKIRPKPRILWDFKPTKFFRCLVYDGLGMEEEAEKLMGEYFTPSALAHESLILMARLYAYETIRDDSTILRHSRKW